MKFFFDNCLSPDLAGWMRYLDQDVEHLQDNFLPDEPDVKWLPYVGRNNMILVTRDLHITRNPIEKELLKKSRIGAFILGGELARFEIARQIITNWEKMMRIASEKTKPFAFRIPQKGSRISKINLS